MKKYILKTYIYHIFNFIKLWKTSFYINLIYFLTCIDNMKNMKGMSSKKYLLK